MGVMKSQRVEAIVLVVLRNLLHPFLYFRPLPVDPALWAEDSFTELLNPMVLVIRGKSRHGSHMIHARWDEPCSLSVDHEPDAVDVLNVNISLVADDVGILSLGL